MAKSLTLEAKVCNKPTFKLNLEKCIFLVPRDPSEVPDPHFGNLCAAINKCTGSDLLNIQHLFHFSQQFSKFYLNLFFVLFEICIISMVTG